MLLQQQKNVNFRKFQGEISKKMLEATWMEGIFEGDSYVPPPLTAAITVEFLLDSFWRI